VAEEKQYTLTEAQKKLAVDLFNRTWELLEKPDRTPEETELMINCVHASCYHWSVVGTALHRERGEQMIGKLYSLLNRPEAALHHARLCLELAEANGFKDWDIAFAYETMARASATAGNRADFEKYHALARNSAELIKEKGDRDYFLAELEKGPWYGMR
jgi:hypothetical protein